MANELGRNTTGDGTDRELEAFFEALKTESTEAPPALLARVLEDAYAEQASREAGRSAAAAPGPDTGSRSTLGGILAGLRDAIGGWPALAGLATATLAGVWIGYAPPASLDGLTASLFDIETSLGLDSSLPEYGFLLNDG